MSKMAPCVLLISRPHGVPTARRNVFRAPPQTRPVTPARGMFRAASLSGTKSCKNNLSAWPKTIASHETRFMGSRLKSKRCAPCTVGHSHRCVSHKCTCVKSLKPTNSFGCREGAFSDSASKAKAAPKPPRRQNTAAESSATRAAWSWLPRAASPAAGNHSAVSPDVCSGTGLKILSRSKKVIRSRHFRVLGRKLAGETKPNGPQGGLWVCQTLATSRG